MYCVTYYNMHRHAYTKYFETRDEAEKFCSMIRKLYPDQEPVVIGGE